MNLACKTTKSESHAWYL